jgi:cytoskeletal protein CcmA (bactofilin family)
MIWLSRDDFEKRYPPRVPSADLLDERRSSVLRGDVTIDSDTALRAVIGGNVTVRSGVQLNFHGVIKGSLTVEPGGTAYVKGVVKRNLHLGGSALVEGVVGKDVRLNRGAELSIEGVVKGRVRE